MALKALSHVHEVSTSGFGGTGPVQLAGVPAAPAGRLSFAAGIGNGHACEYTIEDAAGNWERVIGTLTTGAPDVLSRDIVVQNSLGTGALVNFAAGQKDIYLVGPAPLRGVLAKTANYTLTLGDHGRLVDGTGTWTLSLPAAATLGDGFFFKLRNSGAGTITLDPNGAETIDGAATLAAGPGEGFHVECDGAAFKTIGRAVASTLPRSYLAGLGLANNGTDATNDIDIAAGAARDDGNAADLVLAAALTKRLDAAWALGTDAGGLDTGTVADATYHVWLIARSDTGVVDALFSLSATAPTLPTNYDRQRRIGSIIRAGGAIVTFVQAGDLFQRTAVFQTNTSSTTAVSRTLGVPTGLNVLARFRANGGFSTPDDGALFTDLAMADVAPSDAAAPGISTPFNTRGWGDFEVRTNTSAQIRERATEAATVEIVTYAWSDRRGRDG